MSHFWTFFLKNLSAFSRSPAVRTFFCQFWHFKSTRDFAIFWEKIMSQKFSRQESSSDHLKEWKTADKLEKVIMEPRFYKSYALERPLWIEETPRKAQIFEKSFIILHFFFIFGQFDYLWISYFRFKSYISRAQNKC